MGKYNENALDNIEMGQERLEAQLKKLAETPSSFDDSSEMQSLKEEQSSIRAAMDEIRKDIGIISASMNTVAEAIGTVPTEEELQKQHQKDLQFIIDNAKGNVKVDLDPSTKAQLKNIHVGIGKVVEEKLEHARERESWARCENLAWRVIALFCSVSAFLYWLIPRIKELNLDSGAGGFLLLVLLVIIVFFSLVGVYKWGKSQGNSLF